MGAIALQCAVGYLAELADDVFEDVARSVVQQRLQRGQMGALLQDALQSFLCLCVEEDGAGWCSLTICWRCYLFHTRSFSVRV